MTRNRLRPLPAWLVGSGLIAVSMGVMNVATYGFTLVTARVLGPSEYGALAALMGIILVLNVLSVGLMATAARRVSAAIGDPTQLEHDVARAATAAGLVLGAGALAAAPLLTWALRLDSWLDAVLIAVTIVPLTVMGAQSGLLQGERRWGALAAIFLGMGLGRLGFGIAAVSWRPDATGAMLGVAVGAYVPAVIGWFALRHPSRAGAVDDDPPADRSETPAEHSFLREVLHNSHALLAFFTLSNTDVIMARSLLEDHQSGLYAGGLIMAKAVLFLPQFVVVLVFPSMAGSGGERRAEKLGLLVVAAIGVVATLAAWALPELAVLFVGGADYDELTSRIWAFAAAGTLLALLQLLVYGSVARQHRSAVWVIWSSVIGLVVASVVWVDTVNQLIGLVIGVLAALVAALLVIGARHTEDAGGRAPSPVSNVG